MKRIFIDGQAGTTGLRIFDRLSGQEDIEVLVLPDSKRKDAESRREMLNNCDAAFLCLPDEASRESVSLTENPDVVLIDTSTAHRTLDGWTYGFPELDGARRSKITQSKRIAVPGCHASGFIALVYPLIANGLLSANAHLNCFSVTGYSGGGKKMIADYENKDRSTLLDAPRQYGLTQNHKHLKEMQAVTGLHAAPVFCPVVSDFYSGMAVTVPVFRSDLAYGKSADDVRAVYKALYNTPIVRYTEDFEEGGFMAANKLTGTDAMEISVQGNEERILLTARYDNLGKGASGAAVECLNLVLGRNETYGLDL